MVGYKRRRGKCNGYYQICQYKGKPVISFDLESKNGKREEQRLCGPCAKDYAKKHPESKEEIEQAVTMQSAISSAIEKDKEGGAWRSKKK